MKFLGRCSDMLRIRALPAAATLDVDEYPVCIMERTVLM